MKTTLSQQAENVSDFKGFVDFVAALQNDRTMNTPEWKNDKIEDFLESAVAWAHDFNKKNTTSFREQNTWKICAVFLLMGKLYE